MSKKIAVVLVLLLGIVLYMALSVVGSDEVNATLYSSSYSISENGSKKVYLAENLQNVGSGNNKVNVLQQSMISQKNAIYVIQYDFDLRGACITIPEGSILEFDGGSFRNGSIKGGFHINDCWYQVFDNINFTLNESFLYADYIRPEWFGAKGDYNYSKKTGTNDSPAINTAVNAALLLGVHKIKFASKTYYVKETISINSGDIIFEGVYGELREEFIFSTSKEDISSYRNSTLISDTDSPIVTTEYGGTHPIVIRDINFRQEYNKNTKTTQTKAIWLKGWSGPQSPFIFEYCHFYRFRYAVYVQSHDRMYNISKLTIRHCAFLLNYWCVYFGETSFKTMSFITRNVTGGLIFESNACHHNVRGISVGLNSGRASVVRNVFEGNLSTFLNSEKPTEDYMNYIGLHNSSSLLFENNYYEQNTVKPIKINVTSRTKDFMDSFITMKDNFSIPVQPNDFYTQKICEIEQSGGWAPDGDILCNNLHILHSDHDFEVSSGRIGLFFHDNITNVTFTGDCYVHLYTKILPSFVKNTELNKKEHINYFNNTPVGITAQSIPSFLDGTIHYGFKSSTSIGNTTVSPSKQNYLYLCVGAKICRQMSYAEKDLSERALISFVDPNKASANTSVIFNSNEFDYLFAIRRKKRDENKKYNYQFRPFDALVSHVGLAYYYKGDLSFNDVNWDLSSVNIVLQENIAKLNGQKEGDKFFNHTTSQTLTWSKDNKWVDALGNIVPQ